MRLESTLRRLLPLSLALGLGCSSEPAAPPGQLVVSISSDMEAGRAFDEFGLEVEAAGSIQFSSTFGTGRDAQRLPATFTIIGGDDPAQPVVVRLFSLKAQVPKTLREVVTTVPADRVGLLPMSIQWLCWGQLQPIPLGPPVTDCADDSQTCAAGTCVDPTVDSETLADFSEEAIYGGAPLGGEGGDCLDTLGCFASGTVVDVDPADCSIAAPSGGTGVNVALVLPPGSPGICGPEACLIPLDAESPEGWRREGGRIVLPPASCDRPGAAVAVTTACKDKTVGVPTCGDWSVVEGDPPASQSAPEGYTIPTLDAGADAGP